MTTYNTGNPLGSTDPRDLYDNAENLDKAVNSDEDTFQDRLGKSRLTWAGIARAGSGDPAIAVDAAARAEAAASSVEQNAEQIAQDAAQQAVDNVVIAVDGAVERAEGAADRAETAADSVKPYVDGALSDLSTAANKFYPTLAAANADIANIEVNQPVHVGEAVNGGLWYKATSGATTLTKSAHDPLAQGKAYTAYYVSRTGFAKIAGAAQTNINYDTATRTLTFSNTVYITTGTTRVQLTTPQSVLLDQSGMRRLEFNVSTGLIREQLFSQSYIEGWIPFALVRSYSDKIETTDFQYAVNGVAFDAIKIATDTAAIDATNKVKALEDSLIVKSSNLYDATTVTLNEVIAEDGSLNASETTSHTDFIAVVPDQQYAVKATLAAGGAVRGFNAIAYYDANKNFIRRDGINNSTGADSTAVVTTPGGAYFIRLNMQDLNPFRYLRQINVGSAALPYEAYKPAELNVDLSQNNIDQVERELGTVKDYVQQSANLFDYTTCQDNLVIRDTGVIEPPTSEQQYAISDFIAVEANQQYTMSSIASIPAFIHTAYYTADKTFIRRDSTNSLGIGYFTITIPSSAAYVRFNVNEGAPSYGRRMFNKGAEPLPYVEYGAEFTNAKLSKEIIEQIESEIIVSSSNPFVYDMPVDGVFNTNEVWDDYTGFRSVTSAHVYSLFDNLLASHPDYITKQELADDLYGNPISLYRFKAAQPSTTNSTKIPKIFISCGVHGYEHVPPLAMYLLLEQMCSNWQSDPLLEALRHNVDLLIIPVANPSGFDDFTRKNRNGVDINRNFPVNWQESDPESSYYGGPSAASEIETQNIISVFDAHKDIDIFYDFHNFHGTNVETHPHYIWVSANNLDTKVERMTQALVTRLTRKWQKELSFLPQSNYFCGYSTATSSGGISKEFAAAQGVKFCATFEVCEKWWLGNGIVSTYDATHCKTAVEAIANWLLINLNELKRM